MKIQLLPNAVINKIKAGEMIVRPANVVKELVENAIDAGATRINVSVQRGGLDAITVTDNGAGISADEVELAVQRHATSKIGTAEDLYNLQSLGFRGEALASMAEVSKFSIASVQAGKDKGVRVTSGQDLPRQMEWCGEQGTTVKVKELFFNIPVRRKFIKSPATELMHCADCMNAFILGHPQIAFIFSHNGKEHLRAEICTDSSEEQNLRARSVAVFGEQELLYSQAEAQVATLTALFSPPGIDRGNTRHIYTFVNGRWVNDKLLKYGILRGYHSHLLKGRYPLYVAKLQMHPSLLDVNVHPTKSEVKFQYAKEVQELLAVTIRRQLRMGNWSLRPQDLPAPSPSNEQMHYISPSPRRFPMRPPTPSSFVSPNLEGGITSKSSGEAHLAELGIDKASALKDGVGRLYARTGQKASSIPPQNEQVGELCPQRTQFTHLNFLGVFAKCYLLFEGHSELLVVDQHAFHERILYEQIMTDPALLAERQRLMVAEIITQLSQEEIEVVKARRDALAHYGFEFEVHGDTMQIKSVPTLLQSKDIKALMHDLIDLAKKDLTTWLGESLVHDVVSTIACRAAVRAGDILTEDQLQRLFVLADNVDFYHNCPHGRRVIRTFNKQQVGSWFDRI